MQKPYLFVSDLTTCAVRPPQDRPQGTWSERTRVQTPPDQNVPGSVKTYPGARRNVPAPT